jgi:hypothetical protein
MVGSLRSEAAAVHEEIFGTVSRSPFGGQAVSKEVTTLINEEIEHERQREVERLNLDMNDRKHKYDKQQIALFIEFRSRLQKRMGKAAIEPLSDNVYCRFLDGYKFDLAECEKNFVGFMVDLRDQEWRQTNKLESLKLEDFPELIKKDFLHIIGQDKEGRPIIYFKIRKFITEGTTPDRLVLFNGVLVTQALLQ